jgi:general secretion pathway protein D
MGQAVAPALAQQTSVSGQASPATTEQKKPLRGPWQQDAPVESVPEVPVDPEKMEVSINFVKADIANVLSFLSMASGVPIVADGEVKGTITITSLKQVSLPLAYEVINSALRVRGYTMVGTLKDTMIRVVALKRAVADRAVVQMGANAEQIGTTDAIITQVIPLQHISAAKLREELKPLVADDQANMLAVSSTNTMIITDTEANVRRLVQIVNLLDKDTSDVVDVEIYQCKYASATALITSLDKALGISEKTSGRNGQAQGQQGRPPRPEGAPQPNINTDEGVLSLKGELRLAADDRTNSIIISAARPKIDMVLSLLVKLDINTTPEVRAKVFRLQYADANMVANQLNTLFQQPQGGTSSRLPPWFGGGGGQPQTDPANYAGLKRNIIVADVRTNSVVVTATEQNMATFEEMIKELDAPNVLSDLTRTFQLKYAKATEMAQTLTSLFRGNTSRGFSFRDLFMGTTSQTGDPIASLRNITVVADAKTNTLLLTGPPQAFGMIESIIAQLDRRTTQVFIEVAIVDVTLDDSTKFGIEWQWKDRSQTTDHTAETDFGLHGENIGLRYGVISTNLQALLHALKTRSDVKVYSTPSITTADNVAAMISIGRDEPFVSTETETSGGNFRRTVDFKNVSITLNVTPRVSDVSNLISLDVSQTINELIGREQELNAPIIANRQAKTTVMVNDGQTIVIGGIIKENKELETSAVPVLSKIPLLGEAFKSRRWKTQQSELMVFLTPHILRDETDVENNTAQEREKLTDPNKAFETQKR